MSRILILVLAIAGCTTTPTDINLDGYVDADFDNIKSDHSHSAEKKHE
jgi:hypothetical protein